MADAPPPPRPPPHANSKPSGLPNGNYDIFIIPPHSAGSGFLYLPSLKPNINSFIAGFCSALLLVAIYSVLVPALRQAASSLNSGVGLLFAIAAVGAAFSFGRSTGDPSSSRPGTNPSPSSSSSSSSADTNRQQPPPPPETGASSGWEKAREETRRREQERRKADEARTAADAATRKREEAEKAARATAEKERWEQARAREKDAREREAREKIARERAAKAAAGRPTGPRYEKPSAESAADSGGSPRQQQQQQQQGYKRPFAASATSSASERSDTSSFARSSASTARTDPPPSSRKGPYSTADPNKVVVCGVYLFTAASPRPVSALVRGRDGVTDGLILRITTEGLFIDDDVRGVPQREWDVKAWGIKLVETGRLDDLHVFRAAIRDAQDKRYVFVLPAEQAWKVDVGLERLRKGSQVRALGMAGIKDNEMRNLLAGLGWR